MKRKIHSENIRSKILHTARRLFMDQGYNDTTIRQITGECDIKIGTLYHFYKDKEDILLQIAEKIFNNAMVRADRDLAPHEYSLRLVKEVVRHFKLIVNDPQSTELYMVSYNSINISQRIIEIRVARNKELFSGYNPHFTDEDYIACAFFIKGFLQSLTMEKMSGRKINLDIIAPKGIRSILEIFNVPEEEIRIAIEETSNYLKE